MAISDSQSTTSDLQKIDSFPCGKVKTKQVENHEKFATSRQVLSNKHRRYQSNLSKTYPPMWQSIAHSLPGVVALLCSWIETRCNLFWHSPWRINPGLVAIFCCLFTGYISRWRRRPLRCQWLWAPATSPSNGAWLLALWRTNHSKIFNVSIQTAPSYILKIIAKSG